MINITVHFFYLPYSMIESTFGQLNRVNIPNLIVFSLAPDRANFMDDKFRSGSIFVKKCDLLPRTRTPITKSRQSIQGSLNTVSRIEAVNRFPINKAYDIPFTEEGFMLTLTQSKPSLTQVHLAVDAPDIGPLFRAISDLCGTKIEADSVYIVNISQDDDDLSENGATGIFTIVNLDHEKITFCIQSIRSFARPSAVFAEIDHKETRRQEAAIIKANPYLTINDEDRFAASISPIVDIRWRFSDGLIDYLKTAQYALEIIDAELEHFRACCIETDDALDSLIQQTAGNLHPI